MTGASSFGAARWSTAVAIAVLLGAVVLVYGEVWWAGARTHTPVERIEPQYEPMMLADHRYVTWAVSRNARALLQAPLRLFEAEACFPTPKSLALGEPALTLGLLGAIPQALAGDPELTYNAAVALLALAGMAAMFTLVRDWTGSAAAGVAAALFYQFGRARMGDPIHPYVADLAWATFSLFFARRLFARGLWRDAAGLAVSLSLQLGTSAYAQVSVFVVAAPYALWLGACGRQAATCWRQLLFVAATVAACAAFTILPFLQLHRLGVLGSRPEPLFAFPRFVVEALLVGSPWLHGAPRLLLAALGIALPARFAVPRLRRDPRRVLLLGGLLALAVAMGPFLTEPLGMGRDRHPFRLLAALLPPLAAVRVPGAILIGFDWVVDILAGAGVAGLLAWSRRLGSALPALALFAVLLVEVLGCWNLYRYRPFRLQPPDEKIEFFARLAARGNRGAMFEWPLNPTMGDRLTLALYHRRPTSSCYASFISPQTQEVLALGRRLPDEDALKQLREAGFTTLVVHHDPLVAQGARAFFLPRVSGRSRTLKLLETTPSMTAYEILADAEAD